MQTLRYAVMVVPKTKSKIMIALFSEWHWTAAPVGSATPFAATSKKEQVTDK